MVLSYLKPAELRPRRAHSVGRDRGQEGDNRQGAGEADRRRGEHTFSSALACVLFRPSGLHGVQPHWETPAEMFL